MPEEVLEPAVESLSTEGEGREESVPAIPVTPEKETGNEGVAERASEQYSKILSQVQPGSANTSDDEVEGDANTVGALEEAEKKAHALVELAQVKGVAHAVRVAKHMNDLYVLDTMHDELADKLYDGLVSKGLIVKE